MQAELKSHQTVSPKVHREMLIRLQNETLERIKELRRDQAQESEAESEPEDELDLASTTAEVETHAALIAREEDKLKYIDEALTRLEAGKYGSCLKCGGPIPVERLKVLPVASYCVSCEEKRTHAPHDWGEGTMIPPYDQQWTVPEEMAEPADREYRSTAPEEDLVVQSKLPGGPKAATNAAKRGPSAGGRSRRNK